MTLVEQVRAALAAGTPGEWKHSGLGAVDALMDGRWRQVAMAVGEAAQYGDPSRGPQEILAANADLIAGAPAWLAALCDRVEALETPRPRAACAGCGEPLGNRWWSSVPGRGDLCEACHLAR